jgi:hypothetical protein
MGAKIDGKELEWTFLIHKKNILYFEQQRIDSG